MIKKILILSTLLLCAGCRMVEVELPNGNKVRYTNFLFDTKVGKMEIKAPTGESLTLENLDAQSKALDVAAAAINKVP